MYYDMPWNSLKINIFNLKIKCTESHPHVLTVSKSEMTLCWKDHLFLHINTTPLFWYQESCSEITDDFSVHDYI